MPVQTEYYTDPDKIDFWASEELSARPEGFQDAIVKATYDHAVVATEINVKNFNEINTLVGSALEQVWSGKKTAEEAMTEVKSQTDSFGRRNLFRRTFLKYSSERLLLACLSLIEIAIMPERNKYADEK